MQVRLASCHADGFTHGLSSLHARGRCGGLWSPRAVHHTNPPPKVSMGITLKKEIVVNEFQRICTCNQVINILDKMGRERGRSAN